MNRTEKIAAKVATTDAWVKAHANGGDLKADIEYLLASNAAAESKLAECAEALHLAEGNAKAIAEELERNGEDVPLGLWSIHHAARRVLSSLSALPKDSSEAEGKPCCDGEGHWISAKGECHARNSQRGDIWFPKDAVRRGTLAKEAGEKTKAVSLTVCPSLTRFCGLPYGHDGDCYGPERPEVATPSEPRKEGE